MSVLSITTAFVFGFIVKQIGLPPLVGFLAAGFVLNLLGFELDTTLKQLSEIGIILLLFSIGLKVQVKKLFEPQIWGTASVHMLVTTIALAVVLFCLALFGLSYFDGLAFSTCLLISFALSFSSTVFVVKILEQRGEMTSKHGRMGIGILIMQDLFAVIFITLSTGKVPSVWALALLGLFFLRKPLMYIMDRSGHGELLVLLACILPIAGAQIFEVVGLKPDLGALLLGMLLAGHPKTDELAKAMLGFKDLFLVGFFLTIGLADLPNVQMVALALLLVFFIPLKAALFFFLLTRLQVRVRTSLLASVNLANYSEFGLIVCAVGVASGWLGSEWLIIIAVALSISMIVVSPVTAMIPNVYSRWKGVLKKFETRDRLPEDEGIEVGEATMAVFGMGRIGTGAYDHLEHCYGRKVLGLDFDEERVKDHLKQGRNVIYGDAGDEDFWKRGLIGEKRLHLVMLTMGNSTNISAARRIRKISKQETIATIVEYEDQIGPLRKVGADYVFNAYAEAGAGFSEHVHELLQTEGKNFGNKASVSDRS